MGARGVGGTIADMNLLTAMFDIRFDQLISRRLLGVVYALALGLHLLAGVVLAVGLIGSGGYGLLLGLVVVPAVMIVGALGLRLTFEAVVVFFRGAEDLRPIRVGVSVG